MRISIFFVVILAWASLLAGQPGPLPGLRQRLAAAAPDTARVLLLNDLCWQTSTQDISQALAYGQEGLRLAQQLGFRLGEVYLLNSLARAAYLQHDGLAAIRYYQRAAHQAEQEPRAARQLTLALLGLGRVAIEQRDFAEGEKYFSQALRRMQQHRHAVTPTDLGMVQNHLATLYHDWYQAGPAAPDSARRLNMRYAQLALAAFRRLPPDDKLAACLSDLGSAYALAGRPDSAARYQRAALRLYQQLGDRLGQTQTRLNLAEALLTQHQPVAAAQVLGPTRPWARQLHAAGLEAQSYRLQAAALASQGRGLEAYYLARTGQALLDSVQQAEQRATLTRLRVQFDTERQRSQVQALTQQAAQQQAAARRQRQYLLLLGGLLLAVVAGLVASGMLAERLRRSRAQLAHQNAELTATRAEQDRLYALIAHDLRSPVVALTGLADLLTRYVQRQDTARLAGLGGRVRQAAEGLRDLLDNLLSWALTQRGELLAEAEPLAVATLLAEAADLYQPSAEAAAVQLSVDPAATGWVLADHHMTSTILRNLLGNALLATPAGGCIVLSAGAAAQGMSLHVRDTGQGMDEAQLAQVSRLLAVGGVGGQRGAHGLGLRLSCTFAQAQHGCLAITSQPGRGTTATLTLPVPAG
ncbi:MAG: hypothetical protein EOO59_00060 [Hymenobacter sp.]|nr:MAG: hypothetical protein EOO59_00060 [Hymenobacter sp.]